MRGAVRGRARRRRRAPRPPARPRSRRPSTPRRSRGPRGPRSRRPGPSATGQGAQRGADPRHDEQVVGRDGDAPAAAQVLGEHAAQAVVGGPGAGVVARHGRPGRAPGAAPRGRVDAARCRAGRGAGPTAAPRRRRCSGAGVGRRAGCARGSRPRRRPPGPHPGRRPPPTRPGSRRTRRRRARRTPRRPGPGTAAATRARARVEGRRVARAQPAGAQLGHDGVRDAVAQRRRAGRRRRGRGRRGGSVRGIRAPYWSSEIGGYWISARAS